ncbi:hypothetical protein HK101_002063 [Irineochytrium annulatum]|nr:hypothetical protein HK101_002063 [Irineochytrium annulatum]
MMALQQQQQSVGIRSTAAPHMTARDFRDYRERTANIIRAAAKARSALVASAVAMSDVSDALEQLERSKAYDDKRWSPGEDSGGGSTSNGLKQCKIVHLAIARALREISDNLAAGLEEGFGKNIESHSTFIQANEKSTLKQNKEIHERIRRAEAEARRLKSRDPDLMQQALQSLQVHTVELERLRTNHTNALSADEFKRAKEIKGICASLITAQEATLSKAGQVASDCFAAIVEIGVEKSLPIKPEVAEPSAGRAAEAVDSRSLGRIRPVDTRPAVDTRPVVEEPKLVAPQPRQPITLKDEGNASRFLRLSLGGPLFNNTADRGSGVKPRAVDKSATRPTPSLGAPPPVARRRGSLDSLASDVRSNGGSAAGGGPNGVPMSFDLFETGRHLSLDRTSSTGFLDTFPAFPPQITVRSSSLAADDPAAQAGVIAAGTVSAPLTRGAVKEALKTASMRGSMVVKGGGAEAATKGGLDEGVAKKDGPAPERLDESRSQSLPRMGGSRLASISPEPPLGSTLGLDLASFGTVASTRAISESDGKDGSNGALPVPPPRNFLPSGDGRSSPNRTGSPKVNPPNRSGASPPPNPPLSTKPTGKPGATAKADTDATDAQVKLAIVTEKPVEERKVTSGVMEVVSGAAPAAEEGKAADSLFKPMPELPLPALPSSMKTIKPVTDLPLPDAATEPPRRRVHFTDPDKPMVEFASFPSDGAPVNIRRILTRDGVPGSNGRHPGDSSEDGSIVSPGYSDDLEYDTEDGSEATTEIEGQPDGVEYQDSDVNAGDDLGIGGGPAPIPQRTLSTLYPTLFTTESPLISNVEVQTVVAASRMPSNARPTVPSVYFPPQADVASEIGTVVEGAAATAGAVTGADYAIPGVVAAGVGEGPLVGVPPDAEMVIALHAFAARSQKEMSLAKGDVVVVHKRQGTWIYGTKAKRRSKDDPPSPSEPPAPQVGETAAAGGAGPSASKGKIGSLVGRLKRQPSGNAKEAAAGAGSASSSSSSSSPAASTATPAPAEMKGEVGWIPVAFVARFSLA